MDNKIKELEKKIKKSRKGGRTDRVEKLERQLAALREPSKAAASSPAANDVDSAVGAGSASSGTKKRKRDQVTKSDGDVVENGDRKKQKKLKKQKKPKKEAQKDAVLADGDLATAKRKEQEVTDDAGAEKPSISKKKKTEKKENQGQKTENVVKNSEGHVEETEKTEENLKTKKEKKKKEKKEKKKSKDKKEAKKDKKKEKKEKKEKSASSDKLADTSAGEKKKAKKGKDTSGDNNNNGGADSAGPIPVASTSSTSSPLLKHFVRPSDDASTIAWRKEHRLVVDAQGFKPVLSFGASGLDATLLQCCSDFERPTPIQAQSWPILRAGSDMIGIADTGSGKTLAFGLPGLHRALSARRDRRGPGGGGAPAPFILVLAPTRELARQSAEVLEDAGKSNQLHGVCVYGGVPKHSQRSELRRVQSTLAWVVATPGRLLDLAVNENALDLSQVQYLVLDEADRMLDMGFERDVRAIIAQCSANGRSVARRRQTCMFSATWPASVRKLASEFMTDPVRVTVGSDELSANRRVAQHVEVFADERDREPRLYELLKKMHHGQKQRVLLFALYKKEAARLEERLRRKGWTVAAIHGDLNQRQREDAVAKFKSMEAPLLVATDVAARGLDIPDVELVINYSFPLTVEDYVHRIGRTGRAGKTGVSYTFFHDFDKGNAAALCTVLREAGQSVPPALLEFHQTTKKKKHSMYGEHFKSDDRAAAMPAPTRISFD